MLDAFGDIEDIDFPDRVHLDRAEGWHMMGNYAAAREELARVGERYRSHGLVVHLTCRVHWGLREIPEALAATERMIALHPDEAFGYVFKAMLVSYGGDPARAYGILDAVSGRFPGHTSMLFDLGYYAARCGLWPKAIHWLTMVLASDSYYRRLVLENEVFGPIKAELEAINPQS